MVTYRPLLALTILSLAACETMPSGPTPDAPAAASKLDNSGQGSQFAPNPFPFLGGFADEDGDACSIAWVEETDQNDFLRTGPKGAQTLHVSSSEALVDVFDSEGNAWSGMGNSSGHATFGVTPSGFTMLVWHAQARVTGATGEERNATCHLIIDEEGVRSAEVDVR